MKYYLNYDEAVSILPNSENIHTFINGAFGLVGADWSKDDILDKLREADIIIELTGESARSMRHGMCAYSKKAKWQSDILFIETDEDKLSAFEQSHAVDKGE